MNVEPRRRPDRASKPRARALIGVLAGLSLGGVLLVPGVAGAGSGSGDAASVGSFSEPFVEPTIDGHKTDQECVDQPDGSKHCKPAAGTLVSLPSGNIFYWDALEGTENIKNSIVLEYGNVAANDQSRLLKLNDGHPKWSEPSPVDGGANPKGNPSEHPLIPGTTDNKHDNDGALFCSDQTFLSDGRILVTGGTDYYDDPKIATVNGESYGESELEGLRATRIYDPKSNTWSQTGDTHIGRWYPSVVELADGRVFVVSGVQKLIKPLYPDRVQGSGTNVEETETYDPDTGKWKDNGSSGKRSLPLFPRLHLLPDGHVFYDAAGQDFNPAGQSYDEALWNVSATYDPATRKWTDLGVPRLGTTGPAFRGSTFSVELPLKPDPKGQYTKAQFLTAGGVLGTSPGGYVATPDSSITTVDTTVPGKETMSSKQTGPLNQGRWYSTGLLLPTGDVMAFSGADRDEVVTPGTEIAIRRAEIFDHVSQTWKPMATAHRQRTYHNTAVLLQDGRVLVGGHATISTLYASNKSLGPPFAPNGRDATFEIYSPPYMFWGGRPKIAKAPAKVGYGGTMNLQVGGNARDIASVVLVRNLAVTHLVDASQRNVELPVIARNGNRLTVATPPDGNVATPGPYMLFVNRQTAKGLVPSVAKQVFVAGKAPANQPVGPTSPAAPGLPSLPTDLPKVPGVPDLPNLPKLPSVPSLPGGGDKGKDGGLPKLPKVPGVTDPLGHKK